MPEGALGTISGGMLAPTMELLVPVGTAALAVTVAMALALKFVQRSLRRALLCPDDFPLARKLFPAVVSLVVVSAAKTVAAAVDEQLYPWVKVALSVLVAASVSYLLMRCIWVTAQLFYHHFDMNGVDNLRSRRANTQMRFVEKLAYVLVGVIGLSQGLLAFESAHRIGESLLASAGVAGVVVGFAAQKSIGNLIAGFQIAFTQPLRLEDAVVVEGEWGWVEEINLTYVVIRIWDQRRLVLPITYFVEKPFQNWTRTSAQILGAVTIEVSHRLPFSALERELFRLLDASELWDRDKRVLQVVEVHERSVTLRALMTARDSPTCWDLRCHVRRGLLEFLQREHPEALPSLRIEVPADWQGPGSAPAL